ncbi:MAG: hypothetical protein KBT29_03070, partial [Prevotellaceae bacterium]|nr:hypothetical protein [Candidatus Minthosoma caballi]
VIGSIIVAIIAICFGAYVWIMNDSIAYYRTMKYLYSAGIKPLHTTIHIQPYDKSSSKEAIQLQKELSEHLATM